MSSDNKTKEQDVEKAKAFILAHSKMNDKGTSRHMTQTSYLTYFADEKMISADTIKAMTAGERDLIAGATRVAADDLATQITAAKKNGDDPLELESDVRISRPMGPLTIEVKAQTISQRPVRPGEEVGPDGPEKIIKHGTVNVKARLKTMIDPEAATACQELISKMLP